MTLSSAPPGYVAALEHAAVFDLRDFTKVELTGADAASFLHNLCTQDVKQLPVGGGCEAFLTTAKARIIAHFFVGHLQHDGQDVFWLDTVPAQAERILQTLNRYLISEQVELADRTGDLGLLRLCGPEAEAVLERTGAPPLQSLPALHHVSVALKNIAPVSIRKQDRLGIPAYDLFCPGPDLDAVRELLQEAGAEPGDLEAHEVLRVEAGFPVYGLDMDENRFAVEVGRTKQAICYTKGCYLGQEPIVMARDRGQVNRMLVRIKLAGGQPLAAGTRLFAGAEEVGQVTSSVYSPRLAGVIALAYLRRGHQQPGLKLQVQEGPEAEII